MAPRYFGHLPSGESIEAWRLLGSGGLMVEALTYGGIVTRIEVPGPDGESTDVVLGFNTLDPYLAQGAYMGAIIGRVAGRISGARFHLEGKRYDLAANDGRNHLHGGLQGFDRKVWTAHAEVLDEDAPSLLLTYRSFDGEEGYPGTVFVAVRYTVTPGNTLLVETESTTDRPTPLSLTFHHYFNLAGEAAGVIRGHELQIHAAESVLTDEEMGLLGQLQPVDGRSNDFRKKRDLAEAIPHLFHRHGDLYRLRASAGSKPLLAARLSHPASGRVLSVSTTATHLQFYTGVSLDGSLIGKSDRPYQQHAGVCLECEGYPDGANGPGLGDIILHPDKPHRETTLYAFTQNCGT